MKSRCSAPLPGRRLPVRAEVALFKIFLNARHKIRHKILHKILHMTIQTIGARGPGMITRRSASHKQKRSCNWSAFL